jgi:hypothetical protein
MAESKSRPLPGVIPFRVPADVAAWLVGEPTVAAFLLRVSDGTYPQGKQVGRRKLWISSALRRAIDPDDSTGEIVIDENALLARLDRAQDQHQRR